MSSGKILFFGKLADIAGADEWVMPSLSAPLPASQFIAQITTGHPELAKALADTSNRLCLNQSMIPTSEDPDISPQDEVAFLPPMSGG